MDPAIVVAIARRWIGTPYHHQASLRGVGCDCLGLIRGVWRGLCGPEPERLPPYTADWGSVTGEDTMLEVARRHLCAIGLTDVGPGDVIVFRMRAGGIAKHCGILTEAGTFIHAQERVPVAEVALSLWWHRRIIAAFRFPLTEPPFRRRRPKQAIKRGRLDPTKARPQP